MMRYRVLGKLDVSREDQAVDLGAFRQRALLALLLTAPNTVFSTDEIIDGLWGEEGGTDKQNSLWVYVSGLRKALEPDRAKGSEPAILLTRSPGYVIEVDPDAVDSLRFERSIAEGRALAATDPAAASLVLGEALASWHGRAFEEFTYESFAQTEIARLEGLRVDATEARIDVDLERGMSRELVSELEALVRQHPLRERFTGQLMVALYRSGRQAEALRAYQHLRSRLGEELGLEPSREISRLEERVVTGDLALPVDSRAAVAGRGEPGLAVRGYELREKIGEGAFGIAYRAYQPAVGREVAIKVIRPELANDPAFIRRFEAEAQLVASLEHPHIVPLYDYWREPGAAYLVMRLMQGGSLAGLLNTRGLTPPEAARVADQLGGALATAHRAGVVHRDIKPANILLDGAGNAYLSDFGIAFGPDGGMSDDPSASSTLSQPYASPEQLVEGTVTAASDVYSLGVVMAQSLTGLPGLVEEIRGALPAGSMRVIDRATDPDADQRYEQVEVFAAELGEALGEAEGPQSATDVELENPFKGLRAFGAADTADFYGRWRLVDRLVARLGEPGARGRFVALVGPSGSGKSSVVRAGLLPAVRGGALPSSDRWYVVELTPAPHPFEQLEEALLGIAVDPPPALLELLAGSDDGLRQAVRRVLPQEGSQLLVVIDQFEELFTQVDEATANRFMNTLVDAIGDPHSGVRVLVTLRADFYEPPLRHRGMGELLRDGTEVITPMTPHELSTAITGPVERLGVTVEPALVSELVHDVVDRAGALPLLQYTLTELFDARQGMQITASSYHDLGGVSGVLATRADGLLAHLGDDAYDVTRQVLLRLVTLGEGADDTRRRVLQSELEQLDVDMRLLHGVLDTFGRHRLLSFDRDPVTRSPTVEISHEALLTEWDRLRGWIDGARDDVRNQRRLSSAMAEWMTAGQVDEYLLRGGLLDQLQGWAPTASIPLSGPERSFLDASAAERHREARAEREREQRALDAEAREKQRVRQLGIVGMAAVLVAALAGFGVWQWRSAAAARDENDSLVAAEEFRTASEAALAQDPELALLLGVEAVRATADLGFATEDAVDAVQWALHRLGVGFPVGADAPIAVRSGPEGLEGVYVLPPGDLVALAEESTERRLTDAECRAAADRSCPEPSAIPGGTSLRFGVDSYGVVIPEVLPDAPAFGAGPLAGTRVTFAAGSALSQAPGLEAELRRFTDETGIDVTIVANDEFQISEALMSGSVARAPDVAVGYYGPPSAWAQLRVVDLSQWLDVDVLRSDFGDYLIDLFSTDVAGTTELQAIPINIWSKGAVFYAKPEFEAAGYEVPATWDELMDLSAQMVADGRTPWCVQWEGGYASGWPGSDFLESLVLRVGGPEVYDAWASGEIPFTSPDVLQAAQLAAEVFFTPGFVRGGPESISRENWATPLVNLLATNPYNGEPGPQCMMVDQAATLDILGDTTAFGPAGRLGVDVDFFMLPPVDPGPVMTTGTASMATALADRPEVRALMEYMASPTWGEAWVHETEPFLSANRRFDTSAYVTDRPQPEIDFLLRVDEAARAALEAGTWRFDASDLMPPEIGQWTTDLEPGSFWQGMIDWVDRTRTIDEVFADIDAAWNDLRAADTS